MTPAIWWLSYTGLHRRWLSLSWSDGWWAALWSLVVGAVVLAFIAITVMILVWLERKVAADVQSRIGPARVGGRFGVLQTVADAIKLILKEDIVPAEADRWLFILGPVIVFLPPYLAFVVVPFSSTLVPKDLDMGVLYALAVLTIPQVGMIMAGWGSNNKYSLLGGMRAVAQLITYEIPMVVAILCVVMAAGSLSLVHIVKAQQERGWFILSPPLALAFILYFICALAEVNRVPFDLPEAESELVAGFHTEYSGIRFAFFFLGEYATLFLVCALANLLFLGGWSGPLLPPVVWFLAKTYLLIVVSMWIRWTLPRLRIDQLTNLGWKVLLPVSLLDLVFTAVWEIGREIL
jgi:NADH-quinone oxidoreductase subunit H